MVVAPRESIRPRPPDGDEGFLSAAADETESEVKMAIDDGLADAMLGQHKTQEPR
jgi:hypothetical protein